MIDTQQGMRALLALANGGAEVPRHEKPGSRHLWPECGARLRGERAGLRCKAAGCGLGGKCAMHGGCRGGALYRGRPKDAPRPPRRYVLVSSTEGGLSECQESPRARRRWSMWCLPADLAARLPAGVLELGCEAGYLSELLRQAGVDRKVASRWPQRLGYSVVSRLIAKGRVAFALVFHRQDVKRATRQQVGERNLAPRVVMPAELTEAIRLSGQRIPPKLERAEQGGAT